jgi:hypothetical protein
VSLVKPRNRPIEFQQCRIGQPPQRPQRMLRRNPRFDADLREQRPDRLILASHLSLAIRFANPRNHAKTQNTSDFLGDFLSNLLERVAFGLRRPKGNGSDDNLLEEIRN